MITAQSLVPCSKSAPGHLASDPRLILAKREAVFGFAVMYKVKTSLWLRRAFCFQGVDAKLASFASSYQPRIWCVY